MSVWKGNCRCLAIVFIFFLVVGFVSSKEIEVDFPSKVRVGEKFDFAVKLIDFSEDNYDLKIDILGDGERIAEIDGKSTYYFVKDVFKNDEAKVSLEIVKEFEGEADISIKVRNSKGSSTTFNNYSIEVEKADEVENEEIEEAEEVSEKDKQVKIENKEEFGIIEPLVNKNEAITLQPVNIKNTQDSEIIFKSNNYKIKEYGVYAFALFCVIIIVLLLIERKNR